ncbi:MAG: putative sugar nucleotidyl transferase [Phycisphaerae bacterium]
MDSILLFEDHGTSKLEPLTCWRTLFELRLGRKLLMDRAAQCTGRSVAGIWTRDWMASVAAERCGAPVNHTPTTGDVLVNGRWLCPDKTTFPEAPAIGTLGGDVAFVVCDRALAGALKAETMLDAAALRQAISGQPTHNARGTMLEYPWDLVLNTSNRFAEQWTAEDAVIEEPIPEVSGASDRLHVGVRTRIHPTAVLDTNGGPVFISHDVTVGPYAVIEGPAYIGPGSHVHPHAWLHGGCAIGPVCKVGGELDACTFYGYSNKPHHGFLGHSYVGSWVNLGAGSTNSDLKNTYGSIRVRLGKRDVDTGAQFLGSIIGDHAKIGINAALPTGAVIGFAGNVVSTSVAPKAVPTLSWFDERGVQSGDAEKLRDVARKVMARRGVELSQAEFALFLEISRRSC